MEVNAAIFTKNITDVIRNRVPNIEKNTCDMFEKRYDFNLPINYPIKPKIVFPKIKVQNKPKDK